METDTYRERARECEHERENARVRARTYIHSGQAKQRESDREGFQKKKPEMPSSICDSEGDLTGKGINPTRGSAKSPSNLWRER
jgi:hypothetical protein